jgi:hypothetical protein
MSTPPAGIDQVQTGPAGEAPEPLVRVWVANGQMTTAGPGPGWKELPRAEVGYLIEHRMASHGSPDDVLQAEIRRSQGLFRPR